ncbi:MAG: hypothetical protein QXT45_03535 [Candidatus Bilamarchaeaceae archaeon]
MQATADKSNLKLLSILKRFIVNSDKSWDNIWLSCDGTKLRACTSSQACLAIAEIPATGGFDTSCVSCSIFNRVISSCDDGPVKIDASPKSIRIISEKDVFELPQNYLPLPYENDIVVPTDRGHILSGILSRMLDCALIGANIEKPETAQYKSIIETDIFLHTSPTELLLWGTTRSVIAYARMNMPTPSPLPERRVAINSYIAAVLSGFLRTLPATSPVYIGLDDSSLSIVADYLRLRISLTSGNPPDLFSAWNRMDTDVNIDINADDLYGVPQKLFAAMPNRVPERIVGVTFNGHDKLLFESIAGGVFPKNKTPSEHIGQYYSSVHVPCSSNWGQETHWEFSAGNISRLCEFLSSFSPGKNIGIGFSSNPDFPVLKAQFNYANSEYAFVAAGLISR